MAIATLRQIPQGQVRGSFAQPSGKGTAWWRPRLASSSRTASPCATGTDRSAKASMCPRSLLPLWWSVPPCAVPSAIGPSGRMPIADPTRLARRFRRHHPGCLRGFIGRAADRSCSFPGLRPWERESAAMAIAPHRAPLGKRSASAPGGMDKASAVVGALLAHDHGVG
jgi:hypothetical protein